MVSLVVSMCVESWFLLLFLCVDRCLFCCFCEVDIFLLLFSVCDVFCFCAC